MDGQPSRTAMMAAVLRGRHRLDHEQPWVLDDPFALSLVGPGWEAIRAGLEAIFPQDVVDGVGASTLVRARYAEDRVYRSDPEQYVILGAGLDSFAWRRPDLLRSMHIFEVDHPLTQAWKRERAAVLALPAHENHTFVPVDFEVTTLEEGLASAGFDPRRRTVVSWSGVTLYLSPDAIKVTLASIANMGTGTELVMDYAYPDDLLDDVGQRFFTRFVSLAEESGEPVLGRFSPKEIADLVEQCGLKVADDPATDELRARYFAERRDGLRPPDIGNVLTAIVE